MASGAVKDAHADLSVWLVGLDGTIRGANDVIRGTVAEGGKDRAGDATIVKGFAEFDGNGGDFPRDGLPMDPVRINGVVPRKHKLLL